MRIEPHLYLIGSGQGGFDLTDPYDCNIYLFDAGDGFVIFDAGAGMDVDQILTICRQDGVNLEQIRHLILTHAHGDHAGGAAHLADRLPIEVYAGPDTANIVSTGDEAAVCLDIARAGGMYPADYVYRACAVGHVLLPGSMTTIGHLTIEALATPGHSHDHISYVVSGLNQKRYLVGGDAIFFGGKIILQNTYDCNVPQSLATIQALNEVEFDALLPGHLNFSLNNAKRHVKLACEVIDRMCCPESII